MKGKKTPKNTKEASKTPVAETAGDNVREYDNFSVAKEAVAREFNIPKKNLRTPTALDKVAKEKGFIIMYKNAEQ